ncbi:hypothetical protein Y032_0164g3554 [Ancylostoma ceylanicum]|uniref:Uncharacterized protein n=1 Tax=Ancylostoma ceylanicum TaxID=53326 RepID=A0A016SXE9_9BILA|nr:hypothetical protein Y032_0164g3554 [Ancylostoma ceylanicum]
MGPAHKQNLPCKVLGARLAVQPHFLPSAAKKFLNATWTFYGIRLKLEPYRRIAELNQPQITEDAVSVIKAKQIKEPERLQTIEGHRETGRAMSIGSTISLPVVTTEDLS